jgi:hypothetical protein
MTLETHVHTHVKILRMRYESEASGASRVFKLVAVLIAGDALDPQLWSFVPNQLSPSLPPSLPLSHTSQWRETVCSSHT